MSRSKSKFTQSDATRLFKAASRAGVDVRVELPDGTIISTIGTIPPSQKTAVMSADDELERWRRNRGNANQR